MSKVPLHVTLAKLAADSREALAKDLLSLNAVRDASSAAACKGLNEARINVGEANLAGTKAMTALEQAFPGLRFRWVENADRDGTRFWELRVVWPS